MSNFRTVRVSKFRHVYGQPSRRELCYEGIRVTGSAHDNPFCAVNPKFIAVVLEVAGGGAFQVLPLRWSGKVNYHTGRVSGHNGVVNDLKWNPFNDNIIASCADDSKRKPGYMLGLFAVFILMIKLWYVPDGGVKLFLSQCLCELNDHTRRVVYLEWHPTVEGVLASAGGDFKVRLWNVNKVECFLSIDCHQDLVYSVAFNYDGTLLATTCKDKRLRVFDARTGHLHQESDCHLGAKCSKVAFLGDKRKLLTTGFSRMSHRQMAVWSQDDISSPLIMQEIDTSAGVLFPFYDSDLNILYVAGKGDGNIRYYEILAEFPYVAFLSEYQSKFPQRGLGMMPKRGLDVTKCEIYRFYKIHASQCLVEPLSFIVPRKSECFQVDLYPSTPGPTPALTLKEWLCGIVKDPIRISLQANFSTVTNKPVQMKMAFDEEGDSCRPTLITSDLNNERKFQFLSSVTKADYRDITQREDYPDLIKQQQLLININRHIKATQSLDEGPPLTSPLLTRRFDQPSTLAVNANGHHPKWHDNCDVHCDANAEVVLSESEELNDAGDNYKRRSTEGFSAPAAKSPPTCEVVSGHANCNDAAAVQASLQCPCDHCSAPAPFVVSVGDVCRRVPKPFKPMVGTSGTSLSGVTTATSTTSISASPLFIVGSDDICRQRRPIPLSSPTTSDGSFSSVASTATTSSASLLKDEATAALKTPAAIFSPPTASSAATLNGTTAQAYLLTQTASEKRIFTKPGRITPGPLKHRQPTQHIVRPFRVSQSQPPTPRSSNLVASCPDTSAAESSGQDGEIKKLYAEQCKRLRELMAEVEPKDKRIDQLERDLANLTVKVESLQSDLHVKQEDIESLRYEIAWKNKRITQLEQLLYKEGR